MFSQLEGSGDLAYYFLFRFVEPHRRKGLNLVEKTCPSNAGGEKGIAQSTGTRRDPT